MLAAVFGAIFINFFGPLLFPPLPPEFAQVAEKAVPASFSVAFSLVGLSALFKVIYNDKFLLLVVVALVLLVALIGAAIFFRRRKKK